MREIRLSYLWMFAILAGMVILSVSFGMLTSVGPITS
jgi:hypothetical protein